MERKELYEMYYKLFKTQVPKTSTRRAVEEKILTYIDEQNNTMEKAKEEKSSLSGGRIKYWLKPGEKIVRPYKRYKKPDCEEEEHVVIGTLDGKVEYRGRKYDSLSAVSRLITGRSKASGPKFFGLLGKLEGKFKRTS
jgi:hypothetical protein